jgi:hypothetical protein
MTFERHTTHWRWIGILILPIASVAVADNPQETFDLLYKEQMEAVQKTRDRGDDLDLAEEMLDSAKGIPDSPKVQALVLKGVIALARNDRSGYEIVLSAATLLLETEGESAESLVLEVYAEMHRRSKGDRRTDIAEPYARLLLGLADRKAEDGVYDISIRLYRKALPLAAGVATLDGDAILDKIRQMGEQKKIERRINSLRARLDKDSGDKDAKSKLAVLLFTERGDLDEARTLADHDRKLSRMFSLLSTNPSDLPDADLLDLAMWLHARSETASPSSRKRLLADSRKYVDRHLAVHTAKDVAGLKATRLAELIDRALSEIAKPRPRRPRGAARRMAKIHFTEFDPPTYSPFNRVRKARLGKRQAAGWEGLPLKYGDWVFSTWKHHHGRIKFDVVEDGVVWLTTVIDDWGDRGLSSGDWRKKVMSEEDVANAGWRKIIDVTRHEWMKDGTLSTKPWRIYERLCRRGESILFRIKKYATPRIMYPPGVIDSSMIKEEP